MQMVAGPLCASGHSRCDSGSLTGHSTTTVSCLDIFFLDRMTELDTVEEAASAPSMNLGNGGWGEARARWFTHADRALELTGWVTLQTSDVSPATPLLHN